MLVYCSHIFIHDFDVAFFCKFITKFETLFVSRRTKFAIEVQFVTLSMQFVT